jgi:hypothetical protein
MKVEEFKMHVTHCQEVMAAAIKRAAPTLKDLSSAFEGLGKALKRSQSNSNPTNNSNRN